MSSFEEYMEKATITVSYRLLREVANLPTYSLVNMMCLMSQVIATRGDKTPRQVFTLVSELAPTDDAWEDGVRDYMNLEMTLACSGDE